MGSTPLNTFERTAYGRKIGKRAINHFLRPLTGVAQPLAILQTWFDESCVIPVPVVSDHRGTGQVAYICDSDTGTPGPMPPWSAAGVWPSALPLVRVLR
jgi:hypothetical protein